MKYICNPMNIEYKYQFVDTYGMKSVTRESADPSLILFKNEYYLFPSMIGGFLVSDDLAEWKYYPLKNVPIHDYAPDVRVIGEYIYFSASRSKENCPFFRSKDPKNEPFEEVSCTFTFWDPNLFADDDGKVYFYWGCSNKKPIYGVELNLEDMTQKGEVKELVFNRLDICGYERVGENHKLSFEKGSIDEAVIKHIGTDPYIEGVWMTKYNDKYYLQYAATGAEYNVYLDGVYESDNPLGPFTLARNNPYSYKPGGFCPGAGHGSTMNDRYGNWWHTATSRISVGQQFERRIGIWPAGFDSDGELFCNQRYGDWVSAIPDKKVDPWADPEWMLLSSGKSMIASSFEQGYEPNKASEENIRTWWKAATNKPDEWVMIDLGENMDVRAIQINFADDNLKEEVPAGVELVGGSMKRFIDLRHHFTRWVMEGSKDGVNFEIIEDKSKIETDLSHDLIVKEDGINVRYIKVTVKELPFNQKACISGLRVFGNGNGDVPKKVSGVSAFHIGPMNVMVKWNDVGGMGYNVLWGHKADKLYHSYMVFDKTELDIGAIVKGESYFLRVDSFNENGITVGDVVEVK